VGRKEYCAILGYDFDKLLCLFFGSVWPPIGIPVAHTPLFWPFSNNETNPAVIHSFQMVCPQKSQPNPLDTAQQFTRSSRLSNVPSGVENEGFDCLIHGSFGNQLFDFLKGFVRGVQRDWEDAFSDHACVIRPDG
jgi:hypothetical protein